MCIERYYMGNVYDIGGQFVGLTGSSITWRYIVTVYGNPLISQTHYTIYMNTTQKWQEYQTLLTINTDDYK